MHKKNVHNAGQSLDEAKKVLIMVHGRGANVRGILGLAAHLNVSEYALLAPEATNNTWYPYSFMAKPEQNEPWLSSALDLLKEVVDDVTKQGISAENIYFLGFSQGACLTLEFVARHAQKWGGVVALTGGLIGNKLYKQNYSGDFAETPFFIGTGDPDPHVPLERVRESVRILEELNAQVHLEVYEGRPHTISQDEIEQSNHMVFTE
ncbi:dienelactone hydrolase family protein [Membranicola marinus]|uniref:Dienelactone hydrolase family protein n=1 Tax=Membranihabitans marinus TaxID=1227546 RepID=A0A953L8X3_9BACT|nr:dienelactone hydrolase family protein [Membranihabitans marinus]MBY5958200.1 dienelactone hydrolase family protein [Membranihabitans marinus]